MNKLVSGIACILTSFGVAAAAWAQTPETPRSIKGVDVISVEKAQAYLGKAHFFDMRSPVNFGKGHLKGAVALPYENKSDSTESFDASRDRFDMSKLPAEKSAVVVFYSDGPTGWKSYKAAVLATRAGYTNVKWMRDGTSGWTAKGLPLE